MWDWTPTSSCHGTWVKTFISWICLHTSKMHILIYCWMLFDKLYCIFNNINETSFFFLHYRYSALHPSWIPSWATGRWTSMEAHSIAAIFCLTTASSMVGLCVCDGYIIMQHRYTEKYEKWGFCTSPILRKCEEWFLITWPPNAFGAGIHKVVLYLTSWE